MIDKFILRKVEVSDNQGITILAKLAKTIWEQHYIPIVGPEQIAYMLDKFQSEAPMKQQISDGYHYYLAEVDNPIGYLSLQDRGNHLFISKIYLLAETRGKGYGKRMIDFAVSQAREVNLKEIRLTVNKNNAKTIQFYESVGFHNHRELVADIGNGYVMDDYEMVRRLY